MDSVSQLELERTARAPQQPPPPVPVRLPPLPARDSGTFPLLGQESAIQDLRSALTDDRLSASRQGKIDSAFRGKVLDRNIYLLNYGQNNSLNFSSAHTSDDGSSYKAALRREYRGLVVHTSGRVLVRPLHKFFSIGQIPKVSLAVLLQKQIAVVTRKLNGQMVSGVVVGGEVQMWTRAGPTEVGMQALRVAVAHPGNYSGLTEFTVQQSYTPVFEFIGKESNKKANEGNMSRVVLLAIRHRHTGHNW
eukprot:TRINITY_DN245_c0_g5_i1.p1 TRINITY_DN245_c0_g5~~TRINITY_DN245_c0_g5_i1.p1  ORF type:complete len:248 (+),score=29.05 TRINITY_DN245_c0_g5_i1:354-1097(+)